MVCIIQEQADFFVFILVAGNSEHIFVIPAIHAYNVIILLIIPAFHAHGVFSGSGNPYLRQFVPGAIMHWVSDFFRAGGGGGYVEIAGDTAFLNHVL